MLLSKSNWKPNSNPINPIKEFPRFLNNPTCFSLSILYLLVKQSYLSSFIFTVVREFNFFLLGHQFLRLGLIWNSWYRVKFNVTVCRVATCPDDRITLTYDFSNISFTFSLDEFNSVFSPFFDFPVELFCISSQSWKLMNFVLFLYNLRCLVTEHLIFYFFF